MTVVQTRTIEAGYGISLDATELRFVTSRSGGPGGQNVNKVNTRVTLLFDVDASPSLTTTQKARIRQRLATRVTAAGILRVVSSKHRTQLANRHAAIERFVELLADALRPVKPRKKTTTEPTAARRRRLDAKTRRSKLKQQRRARFKPDE